MSAFTRLCDGVVQEPIRCESAHGAFHAMAYRGVKEGSGPAVVIAPPDGEERDWALRPLVTAARVLARAGCTVLRFDYFGQGESDGDYEDATLRSRVEDLLVACDTLAARTGREPVVIGARLGAPIALLAAIERSTEKVVLWESVLDAPQYLQQLLRVNVSTQMVTQGRVVRERQELIAAARGGELISVNGYALTGGFIDALLALDVPAALDRFTGRALMVASGPTPPRFASNPVVTASRIAAAPIWKEPKVHIIAPTPLLEPTLEWLGLGAASIREAS